MVVVIEVADLSKMSRWGAALHSCVQSIWLQISHKYILCVLKLSESFRNTWKIVQNSKKTTVSPKFP